jgi:hypothetical protein
MELFFIDEIHLIADLHPPSLWQCRESLFEACTVARKLAAIPANTQAAACLPYYSPEDKSPEGPGRFRRERWRWDSDHDSLTRIKAVPGIGQRHPRM